MCMWKLETFGKLYTVLFNVLWSVESLLTVHCSLPNSFYLTLPLPKANLTKPRKLLNPELSNETQRCVHSNERSRWVLSNGGVHVVAEQRACFVNFMFNLDRDSLWEQVNTLNFGIDLSYFRLFAASPEAQRENSLEKKIDQLDNDMALLSQISSLSDTLAVNHQVRLKRFLAWHVRVT